MQTAGAPTAARTPHRAILALALPATVALAADPLLSLVDTAIVGRLGTAELAALGVCTAVFAVTFLGFNFLTYGTTEQVARRRAAGDVEGAARHALQALWLAVGLGVTASVVLVVAAGTLVAVMGATGEVVPPALAYLRVRALAAVPVLVVMVGHGAFRGLHDTRTPLYVTVAANAANAVVSWVLVFGVGMGVTGAAWGTVVAQSAAAVAFLALARARFRIVGLRPDPAGMRAVVAVSTALFLRTAALLGGLTVTTAVAARMGTTTVAAHQVARELWLLLVLVLDGFAIAGQALVASALGVGSVARARADARRLVGWGVVAGVAVGLGYQGLAGVLPRLFTADPAVLAAVASVWPVVVLLQPVGGVVFVLDGVLMGAGDYRFLLWSTAAAALLGLVPVALAALVFGWGLPGVWAGMATLMVARLGLLVWRVAGPAWTAV